MDPLHSVHKSTISPSESDLCPVKDTCNWGRSAVAPLGGKKTFSSYIPRRWRHAHACANQSAGTRLRRTQWHWQINRGSLLCVVHYFPARSGLVPPPPPYTPTSHSPRRGLTICWKGWMVYVARNTKQAERSEETWDAYPNVIQSTPEIDSERERNESQLPRGALLRIDYMHQNVSRNTPEPSSQLCIQNICPVCNGRQSYPIKPSVRLNRFPWKRWSG